MGDCHRVTGFAVAPASLAGCADKLVAHGVPEMRNGAPIAGSTVSVEIPLITRDPSRPWSR